LEGFGKQPGKEKEIVLQIEAWGGSIENEVAKSTTALIIADKGKTVYNSFSSTHYFKSI